MLFFIEINMPNQFTFRLINVQTFQHFFIHVTTHLGVQSPPPNPFYRYLGEAGRGLYPWIGSPPSGRDSFVPFRFPGANPQRLQVLAVCDAVSRPNSGSDARANDCMQSEVSPTNDVSDISKTIPCTDLTRMFRVGNGIGLQLT